MFDLQKYYQNSVDLLCELIVCPSFSKEEDAAADLIQTWFREFGIDTERKLNNVYARSPNFNTHLPTILLNSHLDTVRPSASWVRDPFKAAIEDGKIFGLGSNDAGGALVSLATIFIYYYQHPSDKFNLIFAASAEEEISGQNGIQSLLPELGKIDFAIVGEPTEMKMAIAERGLMVLDLVAYGETGHAAGEKGVNAIYKAMKDIEWIRNYQFPKNSELLGPVKMQVTSIDTENKQHNVIPDSCHFVADIRINEHYSHEEILSELKAKLTSDFVPRSTRLRSSMIPLDHPLVKSGLNLGWEYYGSPTISDKALMPFPALKLGPGLSSRSHTADEFIYLEEIKSAIQLYYQLLENLEI
jgi:acetylornithine deacetylase